jgi:hypothetical protein
MTIGCQDGKCEGRTSRTQCRSWFSILYVTALNAYASVERFDLAQSIDLPDHLHLDQRRISQISLIIVGMLILDFICARSGVAAACFIDFAAEATPPI